MSAEAALVFAANGTKRYQNDITDETTVVVSTNTAQDGNFGGGTLTIARYSNSRPGDQDLAAWTAGNADTFTVGRGGVLNFTLTGATSPDLVVVCYPVGSRP